MSSTTTVMNTSRSKLARDSLGGQLSASRRCFQCSTLRGASGRVSALRKRSSPPEYLDLLNSAEDCVQNTGNSCDFEPMCRAVIEQILQRELAKKTGAHTLDPAIESLQYHVQLVSGLAANRFASLDHRPKLPRKKERHPRQTHANNAKDTPHGEGSEEPLMTTSSLFTRFRLCARRSCNV